MHDSDIHYWNSMHLEETMTGETTAVMAVDPGKATGFAMCLIEPDDTILGVRAWEQYTHEAACRDIRDFMPWSRFSDRLYPENQEVASYVLVMEDFRISMGTAKKTQARWSLELIGVGRWMCSENVCSFYLQQPAEAKTFAPDHRLKRMNELVTGFWCPTKGGHANDALRHLLYWLVRNNHLTDDMKCSLVTQ